MFWQLCKQSWKQGFEKVVYEICLYGQVGFLTRRVQYKCKTRRFQSPLFPTTGLMIYWQVRMMGFIFNQTRRCWDRIGRWQGFVLGLWGDWTGTTQEGSFCLSQLFPVTLTVKLILKGGVGVIWLESWENWQSDFYSITNSSLNIFVHSWD